MVSDAYYTQESLQFLKTVDNIPLLRAMTVPHNRYVCARSNGGRRNARPGVTKSIVHPLTHDNSSLSPLLGRETAEDHSISYSLTKSSSRGYIPPAAPLPPGFVLSERRLAPLEYLQNISPKARHPVDDEALRQFQLIAF